jgi:hypothetical protein
VIVGPTPTGLRRSRAWIAWLGLAVATFAGLLILGRHLTFWQDEWAFIGADPTGLASYLEPHNEHWSTVPLILYRGVLAVVGLHTYLPYLAVLALLHVVAAGGAFVLLIRRLPGWAALLAVLPLLVLGSGFENVLWAFQIGFVGSVAAGTWGLVALESDQRRWTAIAGVALLIVGLASSGMGIFFVVAAAVRLFVDPIFRRRSVWVLIPAVVFAVWYLTFGRNGEGGGFASVGDVIRFAARGLTYAVGRIGGFDLAGRASLLGWIGGAAVLLLVVVVFIRLALGRRMAPLALGGVGAALAMYVVIGLTRADLASDFATRSRYVYVAAFLLIPAVGDLIAAWSPGVRLPRAGVAVLVALAVLSVGVNVVDLRDGRAIFIRDAALTRAYLTVLTENSGATWTDPAMPLGWPAPDRIATLLDRYGSPLEDTLVPSNVTRPSAARLEQALIALAHGAFTATPDGSAPAGQPQVPAVLDSSGATATPTDSCLSVTTTSADGWITVSVADGGQLTVDGATDGTTLSLGRALPPAPSNAKPLPPSPTGTWSIAVPDLSGDAPWQARLDLPVPVTIRLCSFA